jgi:chromosomal replication initiator protein
MTQGTTSCWQSFLQQLEEELGKETIDRWARTLVIKQSTATKLVLEARDSFQSLWFEEHLRPRLSLLVDQMSSPIQVSLQVSGKPTALKQTKKDFPSSPVSSLTFQGLEPAFTFEHFFPIEENEIVLRLLDEICSHLAHSKLQKMSSLVVPTVDEKKISLPNPIYLCGPSGCGKTHVLTATAHRLRQAGNSVIMAQAELFTDHVVKSIRAGEMSTFRKLWRNVDVLLLDDVHLLARKNATQEEFFHTFNTLHTAGKQIVLSANCLPQQLQFIEPRLVSRFEWGIVLPMYTLGKKYFPMLLEKKAAFHRFPLSQKIAVALAEMFSSTPKACMKALDALMYRHNLAKNKTGGHRAELSYTHVRDLLADLIEDEKNLALTPEKIITITAEGYGVTREDLLGRSQRQEFVLPRQVTMYLMRKHLKLPFMQIGDLLQKNHSTVMSSIRHVEKAISDPSSDLGSVVASIEIRLADIKK